MTPRFDRVVRGLAAVAAVAALAVFPGCSETPGRSPDAAAPASIDDAALPVDGASTEDRGAEPDAGPPALAACTCDPDETCTACVENLATCCYGDPELSGQAALLAATCEAAAPCRACCDECAAASCETLRATGSCPNLAPNEPFPVSSTNGGLLNGGPLSEFHTKPLATNADLATALKDAPGFVPIFKYLVECALPADQQIELALEPDGPPTVFHGSVGLAPEWQAQACDVACQEWVSACLFARTNRYGLKVHIYLSGPHPALAPTPGPGGTALLAGFTVREGAFYGNLFQKMPHEHACRGDGADPLYQAIRVCALPGNLCGFSQVGPCGAVDGDTQRPSARHACESISPDGDYLDCHDRATVPGSESFPEPNRKYSRVITIWVRPSLFQGGVEATGLGSDAGPVACGDPPPAVPELGPLRETPAGAGARCVNDDDCASELLSCDPRTLIGLCSAPCEPSLDRGEEREACGGAGSTCLARGPDEGLCTHACTAGARPGSESACEPGELCTNLWLYSAMPDPLPGCVTFCSRDSDCPTGVPCHTRVGGCGATVDLSLLPDGEPCDFRVAPCRGACLVVGDAPEKGICSTLLNFAETRTCPDSPEVIEPLAPGGPGRTDDLAVCLYRKCTDDADCTAPLACREGVLPNTRVCTWP